MVVNSNAASSGDELDSPQFRVYARWFSLKVELNSHFYIINRSFIVDVFSVILAITGFVLEGKSFLFPFGYI